MEGGRIPIEEFIQFPTRYTFKAIGHHTREFAENVLEAARGALGEDRRVEFRTRLSSRAAHISVTVMATVESASELRAAYAALRTVGGVITVL